MPPKTLSPAIEKPFSVADLSDESACILPYTVMRDLEIYVNHRTLDVANRDFLTGMLNNDLSATITHMPEYMTRLQLAELNWFFKNCMPAELWGSPEKVQAYLRGQS